METVNNEFYGDLKDRWYLAEDDPVALLRAEAQWRNPWLEAVVDRYFPSAKVKLLDIGCGAGFLTNPLAMAGHEVTGLDASPGALETARRWDKTKSVRYLEGDALQLPFAENSFDVVSLMDFLEHIPNPQDAIREAARILAPGGLIFYHTFNRNPFSWLIAIKGVEWFVKNTPPKMHILKWFIKPRELRNYLEEANLTFCEELGSRPVLNGAFFRMLVTGRVGSEFRFTRTDRLWMGYLGFAQKKRGRPFEQPRFNELTITDK